LRAKPIAFGAHGLRLGLLGLSGSQLHPEPFRFHLLVSEPSLQAGHLDDLGLKDAHLRPQTIAFRLAVAQLLSEDLDILLALAGLVQLRLESRYDDRHLGRSRLQTALVLGGPQPGLRRLIRRPH
jgi:hypothetical protein